MVAAKSGGREIYRGRRVVAALDIKAKGNANVRHDAARSMLKKIENCDIPRGAPGAIEENGADEILVKFNDGTVNMVALWIKRTTFGSYCRLLDSDHV